MILCLFTSPDRVKRITFSIYALFPLLPQTELKPVSFLADTAEEI